MTFEDMDCGIWRIHVRYEQSSAEFYRSGKRVVINCKRRVGLKVEIDWTGFKLPW